MTRARTGRRPVRPAADDDFEIFINEDLIFCAVKNSRTFMQSTACKKLKFIF